jgi:hypothetical protein
VTRQVRNIRNVRYIRGFVSVFRQREAQHIRHMWRFVRHIIGIRKTVSA